MSGWSFAGGSGGGHGGMGGRASSQVTTGASYGSIMEPNDFGKLALLFGLRLIFFPFLIFSVPNQFLLMLEIQLELLSLRVFPQIVNGHMFLCPYC